MPDDTAFLVVCRALSFFVRDLMDLCSHGLGQFLREIHFEKND